MAFSHSEFTVVIPFYNEEQYLQRTLLSWAEQSRLPDRMILVNNASTDGSEQIAESFAKSQEGRIEVLNLFESRPGKVFALEKAQGHLVGDWAVFCDADTWYPQHYLLSTEKIIETCTESVVSLMAIDLGDLPVSKQSKKTIFWKMLAAKFFVGKCHTGGFGQTFRISALRKCGGFNAKYWNYVLMDHEIVYRIHRFGTSLYHPDLWCIPSQRRGNRQEVRWNLWERILYFVHPYPFGNWFFYQFLGKSFAKRKLGHLNLRKQPWSQTLALNLLPTK